MILFSKEKKFVTATHKKGHGVLVKMSFNDGSPCYEIGAAGGKKVEDRWLRLIEVAFEKGYNKGKDLCSKK